MERVYSYNPGAHTGLLLVNVGPGKSVDAGRQRSSETGDGLKQILLLLAHVSVTSVGASRWRTQ